MLRSLIYEKVYLFNTNFHFVVQLNINSTFADTQNLDKDKDYKIEEIDGLSHLNTKNIDKEIEKEFLEELNKRAIEEEKKENLREFNELIAKKSSYMLEPSDIKAGDIIMTDNTCFGGLTGHVGIAISDEYILHTSGYENEDAITLITIDNFINRYNGKNFIKVYRYEDDGDAQYYAREAATKAIRIYHELRYSTTYKITGDLTTLDPIYCSKYVLHSYYQASSHTVSSGVGDQIRNATSGTYVLPYRIDNVLSSGYYDMSLVGYLYKD